MLTLVVIWVVVLITSLSAPELTFGEEPVVLRPAAILNWLWGLVATIFVLRSTLFRRPNEMGWGQTDAWPWAMGVTTAIWLVALIASNSVPEVVVNEDIIVPIGSIVAPPVAVALTLYAHEFLIAGFAARKPLNGDSASADGED